MNEMKRRQTKNMQTMRTFNMWPCVTNDFIQNIDGLGTEMRKYRKYVLKYKASFVCVCVYFLIKLYIWGLPAAQCVSE